MHLIKTRSFELFPKAAYVVIDVLADENISKSMRSQHALLLCRINGRYVHRESCCIRITNVMHKNALDIPRSRRMRIINTSSSAKIWSKVTKCETPTSVKS